MIKTEVIVTNIKTGEQKEKEFGIGICEDCGDVIFKLGNKTFEIDLETWLDMVDYIDEEMVGEDD